MKATVELLMSMRGCGRILALTLITDLPELGTLDRRQIAAPCGAVGSPQPHAASAWRPSPGTADSEKTSASSKAAEAKSATSPTWPPSAPAAPKTIPSRPVPSPDRPRQTQKARHRRRHARHDHDPRRHAQGQQAVEPRPRSLIKTTVAEESTNEPEWTGYRGRDCSSILRQRVGVVFSQTTYPQPSGHTMHDATVCGGRGLHRVLDQAGEAVADGLGFPAVEAETNSSR